jgi:hypothetical protein
MDIAVIRDILLKKPFTPFVLKMNDGRAFEINHHDWILLYSGHVTVFGEEGKRVIHLEPILIASLELSEPSETPAKPNPPTVSNA